MRIVFFGTSFFAAEILHSLQSVPCEVVAIVTRTDKPQGRDLKVGMSPVKQRALESFPEVPLLQPEKASTDAFSETLKAFQADLFLVVAYGEILKTNILSIPSKACINIHASLLPKYRGAAPMQRCLMAGEPESGVTFMEMVLKMDAGDILLQKRVSIPQDMNGPELEEALLAASKEALPEFISHFDSYYSKKTPQIEGLVTFAAKISPEDSVIDWTQPARSIYNQIKALSPSPGVYVKLLFGPKSKRLKILKSQVSEISSGIPGTLSMDKFSLTVECGEGSLNLLEVQLEGKKSMAIEEFLRGVPKHLSLEL